MAIKRNDSGGGDREVQRILMELLTQMDGFDQTTNVKVIMATNRPEMLDPALMRPGRLDRKVEFGLPDLEGRTEIFKIHSRPMTCERGIRFELLARLCPNTTGAEIRSVCTEAGMFAIRARRKAVTEDDFLKAIDKVIKGYQKFSSTSKYMVYNWGVCLSGNGVSCVGVLLERMGGYPFRKMSERHFVKMSERHFVRISERTH